MPTTYPFPRRPYDRVRSSFIRDEIRTRRFTDPDDRAYVNYLVFVEWYATEGLHSDATGLSQAFVDFSNWRIATKYPEAYDAVRRDCGVETRTKDTTGRDTDEDPTARRQWARRHREEWRAVREDRPPKRESVVAEVDISDRPRFDRFRFPLFRYDELESAFVRAELADGEFDDIEHRRYVNRLVYLEGWARDHHQFESGGGAYPPVRRWYEAAKDPVAFDLIRAGFGRETRTNLVPFSRSVDTYENVERRRERHAEQWRRVQESGGPPS